MPKRNLRDQRQEASAAIRPLRQIEEPTASSCPLSPSCVARNIHRQSVVRFRYVKSNPPNRISLNRPPTFRTSRPLLAFPLPCTRVRCDTVALSPARNILDALCTGPCWLLWPSSCVVPLSRGVSGGTLFQDLSPTPPRYRRALYRDRTHLTPSISRLAARRVDSDKILRVNVHHDPTARQTQARCSMTSVARCLMLSYGGYEVATPRSSRKQTA